MVNSNGIALVYTPKAGFRGPPAPWPGSDHVEPSRKVAKAKVKSGFYTTDTRAAFAQPVEPAEAPAPSESGDTTA